MYSLFIDTHDKSVVIILFKDGKIISIRNIESKNKHSEITMPLIDEVIKEGKIDVKDLNSVIVVNGPGSFTGERIAVTIGKTIAYLLNIPIRVIDSLKILAINVDDDTKNVAITDRNGAFVGVFDSNNQQVGELSYMNKSTYQEYCDKNKVYSEIDVDYEKVYQEAMKEKKLNPHEVKPLYVKGISALNDK